MEVSISKKSMDILQKIQKNSEKSEYSGIIEEALVLYYDEYSDIKIAKSRINEKNISSNEMDDFINGLHS